MLRLLTSTLLCLAISPALIAADYRYVRIDVPGSGHTEARGINARGDIVGGYDDADGVTHAFLLRKGVFTSIDVPGALNTLGTRAINARGDIVGTFIGADGLTHIFVLSDGEFAQVDYPGASSTLAGGINNAGDVTGSHDAFANGRGFILKDGVYQNLHAGALATAVFGSRDNGRTVVGDTTRLDGGTRGFVMTVPGHIERIEFPGLSFPCTYVRAINQRGDIVGSFERDGCAGVPGHGFLFRGGEYTELNFPRASITNPLGINDDGVIVGRFIDAAGATHGFKALPQ
jgi:probable HAF family extracellular repeat protein